MAANRRMSRFSGRGRTIDRLAKGRDKSRATIFRDITGWANPPDKGVIQYRLLYQGSVVDTGQTDLIVSADGDPPGYIGFSGALFDEVDVKSFRPEQMVFEPSAHDALGLDNISIGMESVAAVPEPASWAMLIAGVGVIGGTLRSRPRLYVAYA